MPIPNSLLKKLGTIDKELLALEHYLASYSEEVIHKSPSSTTWSAAQCLEHIRLAEEMALNYVQKKLSFQPELERRGLTDWFRRTTMKYYHLIPIKVKAPKYISGENLKNLPSTAEIFAQWKKDRSILHRYLESLPEHRFEEVVFKHPIGGRVSLEGMINFYISHFKRHRKQLKRVLAGMES